MSLKGCGLSSLAGRGFDTPWSGAELDQRRLGTDTPWNSSNHALCSSLHSLPVFAHLFIGRGWVGVRPHAYAGRDRTEAGTISS